MGVEQPMADIVDRSEKPETIEPPTGANTPDLVELTDLVMTVGLPLLTAMSWLSPPSVWRGVSRACLPFYGPGQSGQPSTTWCTSRWNGF